MTQPMPTSTVDAVWRRSGGRCEASPLTGCGRAGAELHHRQPRGMGGTSRPDIHHPANVVHLCRPCHQELVESHRAWARSVGLLVSIHSATPTEPWRALDWHGAAGPPPK